MSYMIREEDQGPYVGRVDTPSVVVEPHQHPLINSVTIQETEEERPTLETTLDTTSHGAITLRYTTGEDGQLRVALIAEDPAVELTPAKDSLERPIPHVFHPRLR